MMFSCYDMTSAQFIVRLSNYSEKWIEMANCGTVWKNTRNVFVEQH